MNQLLALLNLEFLIKDDALKNWRMLLFLSILALVIIASGHSADKKIYTIAQLNAEIKEFKRVFVAPRSNLIRLKMVSSVVRRLAEKGVGPATAPPIKLKRLD